MISEYRKVKIVYYLMAAPAIILIIVIYLFPFIRTIQTSLFQYSLIDPKSIFKWVGLSNYAKIINDKNLQKVIVNTLMYTVISVPIEFVVGLICALLLNKRFKGRGIVRALWLMPFMFAPIVVAYQWRWIFNDQVGIVNYVLMRIGIINHRVAWLGEAKTAMISVIVADVWFSTPFVTLLLLGGLQSLSLEVYEAAEIDGASGWQKFWYVTLPMMRPIATAAVLLRTMDAVKTFDLVYIMTNGGPGLRTELIMTHSYKVAFDTFRLGIASAIAVIGLFVMLILMAIILFIFKERRQIKTS